ncbi:MAG: DUF2934 domain-containing protein [Flavobacteriales bacterium]
MAAKKSTTATTAKAAPAKKASVKKSVSFEEISKRAYEIYVNSGGSSSAEQNWLQAEKELSK